MLEKKFVQGLFINDKGNAPDWVNAKLAITPQFIEFYNNNCDAKGNLRFDIKTAKETGKQYAELDTWKPEEKFIKSEDGKLGVEEREEDIEEDINVDSIPF